MLAEGTVEAALVPVIEYQKIENLFVVPQVCVASYREVRSVVLAVKKGKNLAEVKTVALDAASRTSAALVQIILREFYRTAPRVEPCAPDVRRMLETSDAALLIGDPAMVFPRDDLQVFDLAALWREHTGLGFVFAMWMARAERFEKARCVDFAAARDEGLEFVEEIAETYSEELNLPRAELIAYLRENICYEMDEELRAGLELFYRLARQHDLISTQQPLRFI
jgi:chorismate dehydratase